MWKIFSVLILFLVVGCSKSGITLQSDNLEKFTLVETRILDTSELYIYSFEEDVLRISKWIVLDDKSAEILIEDNIFNIEASYANSFSAYPGEVSNEIVCSDEFKPEFREKNELKYYLLHSNDRFGIGACDEDSVTYKQLIGWIYCNPELYEIKYFTSLDESSEDLEEFFLSFSC